MISHTTEYTSFQINVKQLPMATTQLSMTETLVGQSIYNQRHLVTTSHGFC